MSTATETGAPPELDVKAKSGPDGSATPAGSGRTGASPEATKENPLRERASIAAEVLISGRFDEIVQNYHKPGEAEGENDTIDTASMSAGEFNLYSIGLYRAGFTKEEYGTDGKEVTGGLQVTTTDDQEVTVSHLLSDEEVPEPDGSVKRVYKAKAEIDDPDNPGNKKQVEVNVDADEVIKSHMARTADSIAQNFTDPAQKELVKWRASGSKDEPSEAAQKAIEKEDGPVAAADIIIIKVRTALQLEINNLKKAEGKLDRDGKKALEAKEKLATQLRLATEVNGESFADLARLGALISLEANGVEGLTELQDQLEPGAKRAVQTLREKLINEGGANDDDLEKIEKLGLNALMENSELAEKALNIQGLDKLLFGREVSEEEIIGMLGNLTKEQAEWVEKMKTTGKVSGGILLMLLLAIPAAAIAGVGVAATSAAKGGR